MYRLGAKGNHNNELTHGKQQKNNTVTPRPLQYNNPKRGIMNFIG
jgi:hypothetical protein